MLDDERKKFWKILPKDRRVEAEYPPPSVYFLEHDMMTLDHSSRGTRR